jgi:hypothetical protein
MAIIRSLISSLVTGLSSGPSMIEAPSSEIKDRLGDVINDRDGSPINQR